MKNLRTRFNRFCFRNRDKGIPNLMLYICLGAGLVSFTSLINGGGFLYALLCFDKTAILQGQVWRLVTWLFTENLGGNPFLSVIFLYFFYRLGRTVEMSIGTFKFNLFYLGGVILMDIFAMIFCPTQTIVIGNYLISPEYFTAFYNSMAYFLHLSMVLAFATTFPDSQFLILFIIPIKAWVMALIYLVLIGIDIFNMCYPVMLFPHCLFPLVGLLNYFLFFGEDMPNLLPLSWRAKFKPRKSAKQGPTVIQFEKAGPYRPAPKKEDFTHKCTVCGRTDATNPELEFRYCSRCNGYHCYCIDHINDHAHME